MAAMPSTRAAAVDTRRRASLSFAPPEPTAPTPASVATRPRAAIAVGPGLPTAARAIDSGGLLGAMSEYPIQIEKVQAPPLRDDILARDRLLDWLGVKIHNRVVLLTAEAGYGKTTLLADFARRTRLRVLWFRLDHGDRERVGFIAYLVASLQVHSPDFAPATRSLLRETGSAAPPRDAVLDTFLRELGEIPQEPAALVFDDFHLVDDAADVRHVVKELLARAPERLTFIFASRRTPPLRLARLRALGEVAELRTEDLRFDAGETERLFLETYAMRTEPGLIAELSRRTEGWAASLQLVHAALHDRDPASVRAFIRSLSGAEGHLYDYLAEEVIGDLPDDLQDFLMRTSLLDTVDLTLGPVAASVDVATARRLIDDGERLGLFARQDDRLRYQVRAHPLVKDFLHARLERTVSASGIGEIHRRTAFAAEQVDWRVAAHHHIEGGAINDARRVLSNSLDSILATGAYAAAEELRGRLDGTLGADSPVALVLRSRLAQQRADAAEGVALAERAHRADPTSVPALLNLVSARSLAGDVAGALSAGAMLAGSENASLSRIGAAYQAIIATSTTGSLVGADEALSSLIATLSAANDHHFLGVALSNRAYVLKGLGMANEALVASEQAIELLGRGASGVELVSARLARASALAHIGRLDEARRELQAAQTLAPPQQAIEVGYEAAEIEALYGEPARAWPLLVEGADASEDSADQADLARAWLLIRERRFDDARAALGAIAVGEPRTSVAFEARRQAALAFLACITSEPDGAAMARRTEQLARRQGAHLWAMVAHLMSDLADRDRGPSRSVLAVARDDEALLSVVAELVVARSHDLTAEALAAVRVEMARRAPRWRDALRRQVTDVDVRARTVAADLLAEVGEPADVFLLRDISRAHHDKQLVAVTKALARKLARRVVVEDLGRVRIRIGEQWIDGGDVRRKVLALLCFLMTKTDFSAGREEAVDALWPEQDPDGAMNSLNQTVYFLRRVFEPEYREDVSPGYIHQDGETIWLDRELIGSRSERCRGMVRALRDADTSTRVRELADEYVGRFALDFAYDDWATTFRDALHASYLRVMEQAIRADIDAGRVVDGIGLAERVHEVDPDSEEIQIALVKLYRLARAFAAAAEKYEHYAATVRELGLEPVPIAEV
jgi:ATP/maltotriose-dependent transcriptional regulator MalT/DNA-binding SARP family transcriptional activator